MRVTADDPPAAIYSRQSSTKNAWIDQTKPEVDRAKLSRRSNNLTRGGDLGRTYVIVVCPRTRRSNDRSTPFAFHACVHANLFLEQPTSSPKRTYVGTYDPSLLVSHMELPELCYSTQVNDTAGKWHGTASRQRFRANICCTCVRSCFSDRVFHFTSTHVHAVSPNSFPVVRALPGKNPLVRAIYVLIHPFG